jgi:hypothetical protein
MWSRLVAFACISAAFISADEIMIGTGGKQQKASGVLTELKLRRSARCEIVTSPGETHQDIPCLAAIYADGLAWDPMVGEIESNIWHVGSNGCSASDYDLAPTESTVALDRGGCSFGDKALMAQKAGMQALVIIDTSEATSTPPGLGDAHVIIPVVMIPKAKREILDTISAQSLFKIVFSQQDIGMGDIPYTNTFFKRFKEVRSSIQSDLAPCLLSHILSPVRTSIHRMEKMGSYANCFGGLQSPAAILLNLVHGMASI